MSTCLITIKDLPEHHRVTVWIKIVGSSWFNAPIVMLLSMWFGCKLNRLNRCKLKFIDLELVYGHITKAQINKIQNRGFIWLGTQANHKFDILGLFVRVINWPKIYVYTTKQISNPNFMRQTNPDGQTMDMSKQAISSPCSTWRMGQQVTPQGLVIVVCHS